MVERVDVITEQGFHIKYWKADGLLGKYRTKALALQAERRAR